MKNPEINPSIYGRLIFDKGVNKTVGRKQLLPEIHIQQNRTECYLTAQTEINPTWMEDLNVRLETVKLLEENILKKLFDNGLGNDCFGQDVKAQATKEKISKHFHPELQNPCTANIQQNEKASLELESEKVFVQYISDKGLILKIYKVPGYLNSKTIFLNEHWGVALCYMLST